MEIPVQDSNQVNVYGEGLHQGLVNKESYFKVDAKKASTGPDALRAPLADMNVRVTCKWLRRHKFERLVDVCVWYTMYRNKCKIKFV